MKPEQVIVSSRYIYAHICMHGMTMKMEAMHLKEGTWEGYLEGKKEKGYNCIIISKVQEINF